MITIQLNNLRFFSFHGVHEEERILGNTYEVNVELSFDNDEQITSLVQTINYTSVYAIVKQRMAVPTPLLETLAQDISEQVHAFNNRIKSISVCVEKKNPPIPNIEGSVSVTYNKVY